MNILNAAPPTFSEPNQLNTTYSVDVQFASEDCFNRIFLELVSPQLSPDGRLFATVQPGKAQIPSEVILSIRRILLDASTHLTGNDFSLRNSIINTRQVLDPNPNLLPYIIRCLRPWRLLYLPTEQPRIPDQPSEDWTSIPVIRPLVDLATTLSALANKSNWCSTELTDMPPGRMRIKWLGRVDIFDSDRLPAVIELPDCSSSSSVSNDRTIESASHSETKRPTDVQKPRADASLFRSGCSACRLPRYTCLSSCDKHPVVQLYSNTDPSQFSRFGFPPHASSLKDIFPLLKSSGYPCTGPMQANQSTERTAITQTFKRSKSAIPNENIPPLPQRPMDPKLRKVRTTIKNPSNRSPIFSVPSAPSAPLLLDTASGHPSCPHVSLDTLPSASETTPQPSSHTEISTITRNHTLSTSFSKPTTRSSLPTSSSSSSHPSKATYSNSQATVALGSAASLSHHAGFRKLTVEKRTNKLASKAKVNSAVQLTKKSLASHPGVRVLGQRNCAE